MNKEPEITAFFDEATFTISYIIADPDTGKAAILDPVLDFDAASGRTSTPNADKLITHISDHGLVVEWILETHAHADHLSAAQYLKGHVGGKVSVGRNITAVQKVFAGVFNLGGGFDCTGGQFDHLFEDGECFAVGNLEVRVLATPGHTPGCVTYCVGDNAFVGDTLFMPDFGTARTDFPGGDAKTLYRSIKRILTLPKHTTLFLCHDYKAPGRDEFIWETSVAEQCAKNVHIHDGVSESEFVTMRETKDKTLGKPRLVLPAIQVNIRAGVFPEVEDNGVSYLKLPLNRL